MLDPYSEGSCNLNESTEPKLSTLNTVRLSASLFSDLWLIELQKIQLICSYIPTNK